MRHFQKAIRVKTSKEKIIFFFGCTLFKVFECKKAFPYVDRLFH